jgi:hypothetical protein
MTTLKALWLKIRYSFFLFVIVATAVGYRKILTSLLVGGAKKDEAKAVAEDKVLDAKEMDVNNQADAVEKIADVLPATEAPVGDDWNKK